MTLGGGVGLGVIGALEVPGGVGDQGLVDGVAVQDGLGQVQGDNGLVGHGLIHGHGLDAVLDVLQVGHVAVLAGDDDLGLVGAGVVGLDGLGHAQRGGVVGAQPGVNLGAVGIVGGQDVLSALHSGLGIPGGGGDGVKVGLAGDDHQLAGVDVGLEHVHGALEEVGGVVVGGVAGGQLNVEGAGLVLQVQGVHNVLALQGAHGVVVEGHVVGHVVVHDQTVIGDDGDASLAGLVHDGVQGLAVDGGHHQQVHILGDHVLDVVHLAVGVVVGVGDDGLIAGGLELLIQVGAVTVPPLQGLSGHGDADLLGAVRRGTGAAGAPGAGAGRASAAVTAAGGQRQGHR